MYCHRQAELHLPLTRNHLSTSAINRGDFCRIEYWSPGLRRHSQELSATERFYHMEERPNSPQKKLYLSTTPSMWAVVLLMSMELCTVGALRVGYYALSCPNGETIVRWAMERSMQQDRGIVASVLRLHFHDCFVEGCDGSVLLDGPDSEKTSPINFSLRGFEVVDAAKAELEAQCPGVVSCADILAFAARDAVVLTGGQGWPVRAGRLDGRASSAARALAETPDPSFSINQLAAIFARKGLSKSDMIVLSGAHTIGRAHCASVMPRLYPVQDPRMPLAMAAKLKSACPLQGDLGATFSLDATTPNRFDNAYYTNLFHNRGLLSSDQALYYDASTRGETMINSLLAAPWAFQFSRAMVRMGDIAVKTGPEGEIRRHCRFVN